MSLTDPDCLRSAAEVRLKNRSSPSPPTEVDGRRLCLELEVHKLELELQNEELRAHQAGLETGIDRHTDLHDFAPKD
jgi:hypothetical protein